MDAIESVLNQTLKKSLYEVILVTNFEIHLSSERYKDVKVITTKNQSIGYKLALGIEAARGNVFAFLEDDDLWEVNKLEILYELFSNHPEIGYYHNNFSIIDSLGREINHQIHLIGRRKLMKHRSVLKIANNMNYSDIRKMVNLTVDFNNSCISIRRELIHNHIEKLRKLVTGTDSFFFYLSFTSEYSVFCDSTILTKYRVHGTNASKGGLTSLDPNLRSWQITKETLQDSNCNQAAIRSVDCAIATHLLESFWKEGFVERKKMFGLFCDYLKYISKEDFAYNFLTTSFGIFYFFSPMLAKQFQSKIYTGW